MPRLAGFKHSEETKRKIKQNNGRYWLGKHHSNETKQKISNSKKGVRLSVVARKNMSKARKKEWAEGKRSFEAVRERAKKLRISNIGRKQSDETIRKRRKTFKEIGMGKWNVGRHPSEETKRKMSKIAKERGFGSWMRGEKGKEYIKNNLRRREMSGLETRVNEVIKKYSLPYKFVGNGKFFIERKNPDFININGEKIAIEVYCKRQKEEVRGLGVEQWKESRSRLFAEYGWQTIFIEDWQTNTEEAILDLLKK